MHSKQCCDNPTHTSLCCSHARSASGSQPLGASAGPAARAQAADESFGERLNTLTCSLSQAAPPGRPASKDLSTCTMRRRTRGRGAEGAADVQGHQRHALPARADGLKRRDLVNEAHAVHQRKSADVAGRELEACKLRDHGVERVRGRDDPRQLLRGRPARARSACAAACRAARGRAARGPAQHEPHRPASSDSSQMRAACCMQGKSPPKRRACSTGALARAPQRRRQRVSCRERTLCAEVALGSCDRTMVMLTKSTPPSAGAGISSTCRPRAIAVSTRCQVCE